jgi:hypothetical protein
MCDLPWNGRTLVVRTIESPTNSVGETQMFAIPAGASGAHCQRRRGRWRRMAPIASQSSRCPPHRGWRPVLWSRSSQRGVTNDSSATIAAISTTATMLSSTFSTLRRGRAPLPCAAPSILPNPWSSRPPGSWAHNSGAIFPGGGGRYPDSIGQFYSPS